MNIDLIRIKTGEHGTWGVLCSENIPFAVTLEPPWNNNTINSSCIEDGIKECLRIKSKKFGETFEVMCRSKRNHILFHTGNLAGDTKGCILIGEEFGILKGNPAILSSGKAFLELMNKLKDVNKFYLYVKNIYI